MYFWRGTQSMEFISFSVANQLMCRDVLRLIWYSLPINKALISEKLTSLLQINRLNQSGSFQSKLWVIWMCSSFLRLNSINSISTLRKKYSTSFTSPTRLELSCKKWANGVKPGLERSMSRMRATTSQISMMTQRKWNRKECIPPLKKSPRLIRRQKAVASFTEHWLSTSPRI